MIEENIQVYICTDKRKRNVYICLATGVNSRLVYPTYCCHYFSYNYIRTEIDGWKNLHHMNNSTAADLIVKGKRVVIFNW